MDEKSTEEYFKGQAVAAPSEPTSFQQPTKSHQRTRSVPVVFGGESKTQDSKVGTEDVEQLHQVSLAEEGEDKVKKTLSRGFSRFRSSTVALPTTALHRSISLNNHGQSGDTGRSAPIEDDTTQNPSEADALPTENKLRFSGGAGQRKHSISREYSNPSQFSTSMSYTAHRKSISSDPPQLPNIADVPDSKTESSRPGAASSDESDDDTASTASSDSGLNHLPHHQRYQQFETHNPYQSERRESDGGSKASQLQPEHHKVSLSVQVRQFSRLESDQTATQHIA
ncbi:hypothetical protein BGX31_007394 [Mortierella sp. GBA43]|nr:hypothetical protein BGX31_007394 [Mortierella sp. GBA43]